MLKPKFKDMFHNKPGKYTGTIKLFLVIVLLLSAGKNSLAQSQWLDHGIGNSISLEIYKPVIPVNEQSFILGVRPEFTPLSLVAFLSGRYNLSKRVTLIAELPMVNGKWDDTVDIDDEGGFKIGNPYIGMEYKIPETPIMMDFGLRIPIMEEGKPQATTYGLRADVDKVSAFIHNIVPVTIAANYRTVSESNILFNARAGADIWFNTKQLGIYTQPLLSALYTIQTGYINKNIHFILGLSGNYTLDYGPFSTEKYNYIEYGLLVTLLYKNIRPAISLKVPGEDLGKIINYVVGLNFTYEFK